MLPNTLLAVATLVVLNIAATTPKRSLDGALKLDFTVLRGNSQRDMAPHRKGELVRRDDVDGSALLELTNKQSYYSSNLYIGSNFQKSTVLVDTGSSDLWVMDADIACTSLTSSSKRDFDAFYRVVELPKVAVEADQENAEKEKRANCNGLFCMSEVISVLPGFGSVIATATGTATRATRASTATVSGATTAVATGGANSCTVMGSFQTADSDTFRVNSSAPAFSIVYGDDTSALGFWGHDLIGFGSQNVSDVSFAVVNVTDNTFGVFGIGLPGLETTYSSNAGTAYMYENFPMRLKSQGIINKNVYSLYLNKEDALTGSVLFGAVDHAKYSGTLQTVPIINIYSAYYKNPIRIDIVLDSIEIEGSSSNITVTSVAVPALLDSGTTYTYLPKSALLRFVSVLGASYVSSVGLYSVSCNYNTGNVNATFNFSGAKITVPFTDLIVEYSSQCYLAVVQLDQSSESNLTPYAILGDNFLRNAYIVYNLDDYQVSLAQAAFTNEEDIEVVTLTVPLAVQAAGYSSTSINSAASDTSSVTQLSSSQTKKNAAQRSSSVGVFATLGLAGLSLFALI